LLNERNLLIHSLTWLLCGSPYCIKCCTPSPVRPSSASSFVELESLRNF